MGLQFHWCMCYLTRGCNALWFIKSHWTFMFHVYLYLSAAVCPLSWITVSTADARHECLQSGFPPPPSLWKTTPTPDPPPWPPASCHLWPLTPPNSLSSGPNHHMRSAWLTPTLLWRNRSDTLTLCYCQQSHMHPLTQPEPKHLLIHIHIHPVRLFWSIKIKRIKHPLCVCV